MVVAQIHLGVFTAVGNLRL